MNTKTSKNRPPRFFVYLLLVTTVCVLTLSVSDFSPTPVSAHTGNVFNSGCGKATIDGNVGTAEWANASTLTFPMISFGSASPFTATLKVMNSRFNLYIGFTINDDEFSTVGEYLPNGDAIIVIFDNDHSGALFQLDNDVLAVGAGIPQFEDRYIYSLTGSNQADIKAGGTTDGFGAASRVNTLNHFEVKHPLCSGDSLDFCLHPSDTVGFRLEYLDAQANGTSGSSQLYPGPEITSEADILIGNCSLSENTVYLPFIQR